MYISADVKREEKGKKIANKKDAVKRLNETRYRVRSQSGNGMYYVEKTAFLLELNYLLFLDLS